MATSESMKVSQAPHPASGAEGVAHVFNRLPLHPQLLAKLPLGAIRPRGWLKHQLDLMVDGMTGRLGEVSPFLGRQTGWYGCEHREKWEEQGWEEVPYWLRGFYSLAQLTGDKRLVAEATRWVERMRDSQDAEGYFGSPFNKRVTGKNGQVLCDLWPNMLMLDPIIRHHEATGAAWVIPFVQRFFAFCRDLPDEQFIPLIDQATFGDWRPWIQVLRAGDMLPHIYWLYNQTGDAWLLPLATRFYRRIAPPQSEWLDHHVINFTQRFAYPGLYATQSGSARDVELSEYWYRQHMLTWGQQPRGIFGADENIRPGCVDPRQGFETCGFGEFARSFYLLGRLTGAALYADRVEDLLFNHFPASQTPDLKALHYLTASNQPQLDKSEKHEYQNKGRQTDYSPWLYRCCQHNVGMTWPGMVENLWQASADGGLVAWMYSACDVAAEVAGGRRVRVREETDYPFSGAVRLTLDCDGPTVFPLYLRIPGWCRAFRTRVNGDAVAADTQRGQYVRIERAWANGDTVDIAMEMALALTTWPRTGSVTVERGPLSYSLKIGERWQRCGGTDDWPEREVFPTTPWNYGLALDAGDPLKGFAVTEKGRVADQPWTVEAAPIEITAPAKRIPGWQLVNETVDVLQQSPIRSCEPKETVTLIPLGCARLRMSCLPVIGDAPDAQEWGARQAGPPDVVTIPHA